MQPAPLVSVVIPTRARPELLRRAIASVFAQTYPNLEVVVVVDGPDAQTEEALRAMNDGRVRAQTLPHNVGGAEARNIGVRASRGEWIAFLDDDDEWLPMKIEKQMVAARELPGTRVLVSCRFVEKFADRTETYPEHLPESGEAIDHYVCVPKRMKTGGANLQTSTLLATRDLMIAVPFVAGLKRAQELVWQIEAGAKGGAQFRVLPETLSILNSGTLTSATRVSSRPNWRAFFECIRERKSHFTPETYAYCVGTRVLTDALRCNEPASVILKLLVEILGTSIRHPRILFLFFYLWLIPDARRKRLGKIVRSLLFTRSVKAIAIQ